MKRIDTLNARPDLFGVGKAGFSDNADLPGQDATYLSPEWLNMMQEELCNLLELHGIALNPESKRQLYDLLTTQTDLEALADEIETNFIRKNNIVDNLTTDDAAKPVSAKQAKNLQDNKLAKSGGTLTGTVTTRLPPAKPTIPDLWDGNDSPLRIPHVAVGYTAPLYIPWVHGSTGAAQGFVQHCSFGQYRGMLDWAFGGFYMAVGGSDNAPTEAYHFHFNRILSHTAGPVLLAGNADTATKLQTSVGNAPVYGARATVNFNGANGAIRNGQNIASVTRTAVGTYQINFINQMPTNDYAIVSSLSARGDAASLNIISQNSWNCTVRANYGGDNTAGSFDPAVCCISIFC